MQPEQETKAQKLVKKIDDFVEDLARETDLMKFSSSLQNYLSVCSKFYKYSLNNMLLIALQKPTATFVAGYKAWKIKFGRTVKKGEKAITILAPIRRLVPNEKGETEMMMIGVRGASVFDISQTEGPDLPTLHLQEIEGDYSLHWKKLLGVATLWKIPVEEKDLSEGHFGSSFKGKIEIAKGLSSGQKCSTLAHELAHEYCHGISLLHPVSHTRKETEAESIAYIVCLTLGIPVKDAPLYMALHGSDAKVIRESLEVIRGGSTAILKVCDLVTALGEKAPPFGHDSSFALLSEGKASVVREKEKSFTSPSEIPLGVPEEDTYYDDPPY